MDQKKLDSELQRVISYFESVLSKIQAGKASTGTIENIDVYIPSWGQSQKIQGLGSVSLLDAQTIKIESWDKSILPHIEKGIYNADLGLTPLNQGEWIMIKMPPMTEERRKDIVKKVKQELENAKVTVRNIRHNFMKDVKTLFENNEVSENEKDQNESKIDDAIKSTNKTLENVAKSKEDEIMKI